MSEENEQQAGLPEDTPPESIKPEDTRPDYLLDGPPPHKSKTKYIKWALMHGSTEGELVAEGFNTRSVDICAQELEKDGHRRRPPKPGKPSGKEVVSTGKAGEVQIFARGSPPEALINAIEIPVEDGHIEGFEKGLKFGANIVVLGVRIAQELSNLGVQQARPLIEMSKSMREGEAMAAKSAAGEAALLAAAQVQQNLQPYLANIGRPAGEDPIKAMFARMLEPVLQSMVGKFMPGARGTEQLPPNWTKR